MELGPWPKRVKGKHAFSKRFDFGAGGLMTVSEASVLSGLSTSALYLRLKDTSVPVEMRLAPRRPHKCVHRPTNLTRGYSSLEQAIRMFRAYGERVPTAEVLMRDFGLARATAYRYVRAYKDALGKA